LTEKQSFTRKAEAKMNVPALDELMSDVQSCRWTLVCHGDIYRWHGVAFLLRLLSHSWRRARNLVFTVFLLLHGLRLVLAQFRLYLLVQFLQLSLQFA